MNCPTCGHETLFIAMAAGWCPRCGTHIDPGGFPTRPKLVDRCRDFADGPLNADQRDRWRTLGIAEAITDPEEQDADE